MLAFATLGPAGSNHELVTTQYLAFHGLHHARIELVLKFDDALAMMLSGKVQHVVQVAVHPDATATVARFFIHHRIYVIDTFIAPSYPLGVLTRAEVLHPRSLALQPATREYVDTRRWDTLVPEVSVASVAEGLLAGTYDSGITALHVAERHPGRFRVDSVIGTIDDPWIVYGMQRTTDGQLLAWRDSPAAKLYRHEVAST